MSPLLCDKTLEISKTAQTIRKQIREEPMESKPLEKPLVLSKGMSLFYLKD